MREKMKIPRGEWRIRIKIITRANHSTEIVLTAYHDKMSIRS